MVAKPNITLMDDGTYHVAVDFDDGTRRGLLYSVQTLKEAKIEAQRIIARKNKTQEA